MLINNDIIAQLTDSQKIRILTGVGNLSGKDFKILGLNGVSIKNIKDYGRQMFPRSSILANSWNENLWYEVAKSRVDMAKKDGANITVVPGAKIKFSPYRREISEDPFFALRFSQAHISAANKLGMRSAVSGYYLTESDVSWMDKEPSERVLNEFITLPYLSSVSEDGAENVMTDLRPMSESYRAACRQMQSSIPKYRYLVCEAASEEDTVDFISRGIICLSASSNALEAAIGRYKKLKASMDRGEGITQDQLLIEEKSLKAISDDTVDRAVDRVIEFIRGRQKKAFDTVHQNVDELSFKSAIESTVLLKNIAYTLPLDKDKSVALIGGALPDGEGAQNMIYEIKDELVSRGYKCVGAQLGYSLDDIHDSSMFEKAVNLADSANTVVLFLGFGGAGEKKVQRTKSLDLPPNQLKLADMLIRRRKNVIGVIAAGHAPDIAFTRNFKAVMLAPLDLCSSSAAVVSLITGDVSPAGKLAYTLYAESETAFYKRELYKQKYNLKAGPFVGYRYYDTANVNVGYPFGHGLTYTKFEYSDLVYSDESVSFTIENIGNVTASEVAQVYAGHTSSGVLRPKKELIGFAKVSLEPHERKSVRIPIQLPKVYQSGEYSVERGEYDISVGSSSCDIRLSVRLNVRGKNLMPDREQRRNYIQSVTNVTEDNYTLEANYCPMKKRSPKNIIIGFCLLALAVSLAVFNSTSDASSVFLGIVASAIAVFAVVFLVADLIDRSKEYEDDKKRISEKNQEYFKDAEQLPMLSTERMFNDEFDTHQDESVAETEVFDNDIDDEISKYIDSEFKIADFAGELALFAEDRGMKFDAGSIENFVVSLATSRLLVLDGMSSEEFNNFILILSDYFTTRTYVDVLDGQIKDNYSLFFTSDEHGDYLKRSSTLALEDCSRSKEKVHVLAFDGVCGESFELIAQSFASYIMSPKEKNEIRIFNDHGANVGYNIPNNVKIIIRLDNNTPIDMVNATALRMVSYNMIFAIKCQTKSELSEYHGCNRYQLDYMYDRENGADKVGDQIYNRIDKLENYIFEHSEYKIGNKLWLNFEKQIGLLISANKEMEDAADIAVATKLLPSMVAAIKNRLTSDDETLKGTVEFIFGEENISECMKFINSLNDRNSRFAEQIGENEAVSE